MYCPNCGNTNSTENKFCRSCGLNLEKAAQSIAKQLPASEMDKSLQDKQRKVERLLYILIGGGISIFAIIMIGMIIREIIIGKSHIFGGLMFIAFTVGFVLITLLALYRDSLLKASRQKQLSQQTLQLSEPTQKLLTESYFEPITSVAERTTELLITEKRRSTKEI